MLEDISHSESRQPEASYDKIPLLGMDKEELRCVATECGMPSYTAGQIAQWVYQHGVSSVEEMTNISLKNRNELSKRYDVGRKAPLKAARSADGTVKYLFPVVTTRPHTDGRQFVETVFIPDGDRATLCVSSQVGCRMGCRFCQTGRQKFEGNLTVADILNQIYSLPERELITNVVFMGQGEPMDNIDNVLKATRIMTSDYGMAWSPKRITVSTVGLRAGLERFLAESDCHLAVSLHNPVHEERAALMPAESGMPVNELISLLRRFDFSGQRRLSFEYTVFKGLNDTPEHIRRTAGLLRGLNCRVNLIKYHPIAGVTLLPADNEAMERIKEGFLRHGLRTTIRASRGQDVSAACGMLSTAEANRTHR